MGASQTSAQMVILFALSLSLANLAGCFDVINDTLLHNYTLKSGQTYYYLFQIPPNWSNLVTLIVENPFHGEFFISYDIHQVLDIELYEQMHFNFFNDVLVTKSIRIFEFAFSSQ